VFHLTVTPGMSLVDAHGILPPALLQPRYSVLVGGGHVRVITYAFAGEPVLGERPDTKHSPYLLRMLSDNLFPSLPAAAPATLASLRHKMAAAFGDVAIGSPGGPGSTSARRFDFEPMVQFALRAGAQGEDANEIYRRFVEDKQTRADAGGEGEPMAYHLRNISIMIRTLNWLRFTYDFEKRSA
jgi:hypothetical protein